MVPLVYISATGDPYGSWRAFSGGRTMCLNPRTFIGPDGRQRTVGCRQCGTCTQARVRDWTGRVLAEVKYSAGATFFTLTYGKDRAYGDVDAPGAAVLTYSHVQKWIRRIRDAGYPLRYLVAGEYGEQKARAHWHVCAFWTSKVPTRPKHRERQAGRKTISWCLDDPFWDHGFTQWGEINVGSARYITGYVVKGEQREERELAGKKPLQSIVRMSRFPVIGARHFEELAARHVEQGLPIRDRLFTVEGVKDPETGRLWKYRMSDGSFRHFCQSYLYQWALAHPDRHPPHSDLLEAYVDEHRVPWRRAWQQLSDPAPVAASPRARQLPARPWMPPPEGWSQAFSAPLNAWTAVRGGERLFWSYGEDGERGWFPRFVSDAGGEQLRDAAARRRDQLRDAISRERRDRLSVSSSGRLSAAARKREADADRYHRARLDAAMAGIADALQKRNE